MPGGRPSEYTVEISDELCGWLTQGKSLKSFCEQEGKPSVVTIFKWLRQYDEFAKSYTCAREHQADTMADELQHIADNPTGDVQRDRLRIDTRKWIASKLKPKKYGDKLDVEHSGEVSVSFVTVYDSPEKKGDE